MYYLQRSQPPMLTPMVYDYYVASKDVNFVRDILPVLEEEYKFWTNYRRTLFDDGTGLFQHNVRVNIPRYSNVCPI